MGLTMTGGYSMPHYAVPCGRGAGERGRRGRLLHGGRREAAQGELLGRQGGGEGRKLRGGRHALAGGQYTEN